MSEEDRPRFQEESAVDLGEKPGLITDTGPLTPPESDESLPGTSDLVPAHRQRSAFFPNPLTHEKSTHLLSVIRASLGEEGVGEATSSGLDWTAAYNLVSVTIQNEGGGSRALVTAGRGFGWAMSGILGVVSGSIMAGVLEPITFGVFMGSVVGGLGVALGVGAVHARGAKKRVARLMDRIHRTMERMGEWPEVASKFERNSSRGDGPGGNVVKAARNIELLEALQDRREAMGPRVTLRRFTYALALGASLVSVLPTALQFFPTEYPLPWIVVGGFGWAFSRTVRRLLRGIRERKVLDREIQARLASTDRPMVEISSDMGSS